MAGIFKIMRSSLAFFPIYILGDQAMDVSKKSELEMIRDLDNKSFNNLKEWVKPIIKEMFNNAKENDVIKCVVCNRYSKPDFTIEINNQRKYISLKSGRSDSVHFEGIKSFILFLRKIGISKETQRTILRFHYGDGTLDGTGLVRFGHGDLMVKMKDALKAANNELNSKEVIKECLEHFVFSGVEGRRISADYLWFGDKNYALSVSKEELINFVNRKGYEYIRTLHIGPMTIQPYLRDVERKSKYPQKRHVVQVKWHYLLSDIQRIRNKM